MAGISVFGADRRGLGVAPALVEGVETLSVTFDGHRVWSLPVSALRLDPLRPGRRAVRWPKSLAARLRGTARVALWDAVSGDELAARDVRFGSSRDPVDLTDASGRTLTVNKWGRLAVTFEGNDGDTTARLLTGTKTLLAELEGLGFEAFIVGGTLLGAVRDGDFLPNDDDADLAYLSGHDHPADILLEQFALQRSLEERGHFVVRHNGSHLQVHVRAGDGHTEHYVDIFTAFFKNGEFFEPIHVQARMPRAAITPLGTATLAGEELPAPADPDAWLSACYGENWRTPDPSFRFVTPERTRRRFNNWFGVSQNGGRTDWVAYHLEHPPAPWQVASVEAVEFASRLPDGALVLELGCGTGADARFLASLGHEVIALDYAWTAIDAVQADADERGIERLDPRLVNLLDRRATLRLAVELRARRRPVFVFARHVVSELVEEGRRNVVELLRLVLGVDGLAFLVSFQDLPVAFTAEDPSTWHYPIAWQVREAAAAGIDVSVQHTGVEKTRYGRRAVAQTQWSRDEKEQTP